MDKNTKNENEVLKDHHQEGKQFIPPFIHSLGQIDDVSWVKLVLPELIWISELHTNCGLKKGIELSDLISRLARDSNPESSNFFALISDYISLSEMQLKFIYEGIDKQNQFGAIRLGLKRLQFLFPESPFGFLFKDEPPTLKNSDQTIIDFEKDLENIFDKTTREAIMVQSTAFYVASASGRVHIKKGLTLSKFPEVENYPHTKLSKEVAASIRSFVPMLFRDVKEPERSNWSNYFWNRGLDLVQCSPMKIEGGEKSED